ncbi:MAG: hypothetical protein HKN39_01085 [Flavobacteriales bacterium]|nr:hypothetical protein [Flavobacteriales bacterium]
MKAWIGVNLWAQIIILFIALITLTVEPLLSLFLAIPFGLWQIIAAIVFAVRSDKLSQGNRTYIYIYLIITGVVLGVFAIAMVSGLGLMDEETVFGIVGVTSASLGISFFVYSYRLLKNDPKENEPLPDILDQF